jgi:glucan phosphorylase
LDVLKSTSLKMAKAITNCHIYSKRLTMAQRELYIKQRYFYVAASLKDIIRRFKKRRELKLPNYELSKQLSH